MDTPTDLADRIQRAEEIPGPRIPVVMPTDAEMLLVLAEAKGLCEVDNDGAPGETAYAGGRHSVVCPGCDGSGTVSLYPTLRERYVQGYDHQGCIGRASCPLFTRYSQRALDCGGRGWVPIQHDVTDEVWQALRSSGHPVEVLANGLLPIAVLIGNVHKKYIPGVQIEHIGGVRYEGENLRSTLLAAAVLATAEEEKP